MLKPMTGTALLPVIIINLILGFTASGINNFAHIGGLITGFTFGWLTSVSDTYTSYKKWKVLGYISFGLIIASFIWLLVFDIQYLIGAKKWKNYILKYQGILYIPKYSYIH
ncbi:rhomboid family intramembrane serine protease [Marinitoga lauensis]|uniref:rhomboid family intramembrane serine protease n=1 Tax=Marinitoga lauensis TaxID=2201189 RepID=UPI0023EA6347|nr:rhomboid family intramembrane serine protease [Marinitoga lauensis]